MSKGYAHMNIDDVEDVAPKYGMQHGEARIPRESLGAEQVGMSFYRMKPGKRFGFGHVHEQAEEVYLVLEGAGRAKLDDEIVDLRPLDIVRCAPEVVREFEAGPDGLTIYVSGNRVEGDGEMIPGWWPQD